MDNKGVASRFTSFLRTGGTSSGQGVWCLVAASCIWAVSFGAIGNNLSGVPASFSAGIRLWIALLFFLPWTRWTGWMDTIACLGIGAVQFGLMSLAYMASFAYLPSHEVVLFTVMTPVYVSLLNDLHDRCFHPRNLLAALLAVAGSAVIVWRSDIEFSRSLIGFLLVEASNLCFAVGQMAYRFWMGGRNARASDLSVFSWLYLGGALVLLPGLLLKSTPTCSGLTGTQWMTLVFLGVVVSGVSYFLWNRGARKTSAGTLAVMNNLKIPLGVAASLLLFGESAPLLPLLVGGTWILLAACVSCRR